MPDQDSLGIITLTLGWRSGVYTLAGTSSNVARAHHYVPQAYLAGFTDSGTKDGRLYAHDFKQMKTWASTPAGVGFERDYYRVDLPGRSPDEIEKVLGLVEDPGSAILKGILENQALPGGEEYAQFMLFLALLAVRIPSVRSAMSKAETDLMRIVLAMHAQMPDDQLEARFERMRREDPSTPRTTAEEFRESVKKVVGGETELKLSRTEQVRNFVVGHLGNLDFIAGILMARQWVLLAAEDGAGDFICSDHPVLLEWTVEVPPFYRNSPGFGLKNTIVHVPLSRKLLLRGTFGGPEGMTVPVDRNAVALINGLAVGKATRFLYTPEPDFIWKKEDGSVSGAADVFAAISEHRERQAGTHNTSS